jgi:cyanate permease
MVADSTAAYRRPYRWVVLACFTAVAAVSQMLWLNFAPLITLLENMYGVSELTVSLLMLAFPLLYVILSSHAGTMTDRKGYKYTIAVGSIIAAVFACMRIFNGSFYVLLAGQIGIAIGQPYVINGISKLVVNWFGKDEAAMATGLGTVGMFIGMALGMGLTPPLVSWVGFEGTMVVTAVIAVASALAFVFFAKENDQLPPERAEGENSMAEIKILLNDRNLVLLFIISFLALGFFNGLTTWLEPIVKPNGINAEQAGIIGALLIVGGIIGSILIPALSDKFKKRKPFLMFCCVAATFMVYPLCTFKDLNLLYLLGGLLGFIFLPGYALLLSMTEEQSGPKRAGAATGMLMMTGNAGAVVVIIAMEVIKGDSADWFNAIMLMLALLIASMVIGLVGVRETFGGKVK